jgi:hypothetical protein
MKFLVASNEPKIAGLLALRGFSNEDRKEGWDLLDKATGRHVDALHGTATFSTNYNAVVEDLDDWENIWFDVAQAALNRKFPTVNDNLFKNLSKVSGSEVVLTVKTFLGRVWDLEQSEDDQSKGAAALLERRGLNKERLDEAAALISKLEQEQGAVETPVDDTALKAEREKAVGDMWAWFKDWSVTARTVVKNRNYHVMLGLVSHHGGGAEDTDTKADSEA